MVCGVYHVTPEVEEEENFEWWASLGGGPFSGEGHFFYLSLLGSWFMSWVLIIIMIMGFGWVGVDGIGISTPVGVVKLRFWRSGGEFDGA